MKPNSPVPSLCVPVHVLGAGAARGHGEAARERLLLAGLQLFAEHGYTKTSIRKIALAANANVAAVSYYFGNKAGLYRAVYWGAPNPERGPDAPPGLAPEGAVASLPHLFEHILEPLKNGAQARLWIQLQRREMLEPTGLWQEKLNHGIPPMHASLVALLCGRLGVDKPDIEVQALAIAIVGPAIHLLLNCEVIDVLAPQLLGSSGAIDRWQERLLVYAEAMIGAERRRRRQARKAIMMDRDISAARKSPKHRPATASPNRTTRSRA